MVAVSGAAPLRVCSNGASVVCLQCPLGGMNRLLIALMGFGAVLLPRGLGRLKFLHIPSLLFCVYQDDLVHLLNPCLLKTLKCLLFFCSRAASCGDLFMVSFSEFAFPFLSYPVHRAVWVCAPSADY